MLADGGQLVGNEDAPAGQFRIEAVVTAVGFGDQGEQRALACAAGSGEHSVFASREREVDGLVNGVQSVVAELQVGDFEDVLRVCGGSAAQLAARCAGGDGRVLLVGSQSVIGRVIGRTYFAQC